MTIVGRKCNQCKDGYYRFSGDNTDGCLKCLCNIHGSGNKSCDHNTGHCHCVEERTNRQCVSVLNFRKNLLQNYNLLI